jgi:putative SOS response-associated peptidase YedK
MTLAPRTGTLSGGKIRRHLRSPLWEVWRTLFDDGLENCAIITTGPNALMAPIHHRAPVILDSRDFTMGLDPDNQDEDALKRLCAPWASEECEAFPVSVLVNSARHDVLSCGEPCVPDQTALSDSVSLTRAAKP